MSVCDFRRVSERRCQLRSFHNQLLVLVRKIAHPLHIYACVLARLDMFCLMSVIVGMPNGPRQRVCVCVQEFILSCMLVHVVSCCIQWILSIMHTSTYTINTSSNICVHVLIHVLYMCMYTCMHVLYMCCTCVCVCVCVCEVYIPFPCYDYY